MPAYRIDNYLTSPNLVDITPFDDYEPDYPYSLTIDLADAARISVIADDGTTQKRFTSPDRGASWEDNGSTSDLHGLKLRGRGLSLFGGSSLKYSDDFGQTLEDKTGNWSSVFGSIGTVRGLLDPVLDGLLPCTHDGFPACPACFMTFDGIMSAQPISLQMGEKREVATDLRMQTPAGELAFTRYYRQSKQTDSRYQFMGFGWTHNHQINLTEDATVTPNVIVLRFDGGEVRFSRLGTTNQYEGDPGSSSWIMVDPASDYNAGTEAARYTITMADQSIFLFDSTKVLRRRKFSNGEYWDYAYNGSNQLLTVTDAAYKLAESPDVYRQLSFSYQNGKLHRVTDHTGRYVEMTYTNNLLTGVTDVRGQDWQYEYGMVAGGLSLMTKIISPKLIDTDENSRVTLKEMVYTVDGNGNVTAISEKLGLEDAVTPHLVTDFVFQANGDNITTETTAGFSTIHRFSGGVYEGTEAPNSVGQYPKQRLNDRYRPEEQADANGNKTLLEWGESSKHLTKVVDALNHATTFAYTNDLLSSTIDTQGRQTEYSYTDSNNPRLPTQVQVRDGESVVVQKQLFSYGTKGRVTMEQTVDPANETVILRQVSRDYHLSGDGNGLLKLVQQHDTEAPISTIDTEYTYDELGRVVKTSQSSTFGSCQYSYTVYDAAGNVEATVCGRQNTTPPTTVAAAIAMYDAQDPVKKDNRVTVHKYDALSRRVETTVNAGSDFDQTTLTFYDEMNRVWRTISNYVNQSGGVAEEPGKWVWNIIRARWEKSSSDVTPISHGNDNTQNLIQDIVYNARGLVESQMDVAGRVAHLIYDDAGRVARTISNYEPQGEPASDPADWVWDETDNRWEYGTGLPVAHGNNDQNLITEQLYDAVGNLVKTIDLLRTVTLTGYDELNRPKKTIRNASQPEYNILADPDLSEYAYGTSADQDLVEETEYDAMGRVIRTQQLVDKQGISEQWDTTLYGYNALGQQVKVIRAASDPEYVLDHAEDDPDLSDYTGFVNNLSVPDQDIVSSAEYDLAGRVLTTEDALHRKTRFVYDGFGRQVKTISNYVEQGTPVTDPANWVWDATDGRWERSSTDNIAIEHGNENDQNLIQETFYDSDGKVLETRDGLGRLTRTVYDASHRLKFTIGNFVAQAADPSVWVWANNRWEDGSGNPIAHGPANDQNIITETLYDAQGRVEATRDVLGRLSYRVYDDLGRVIRTVTNYLDQGEDPKLWVWNNGWKKSDGTTPIDHDSDHEPDQNVHQNIVSSTIYDVQGRVLQTVDHRNNITLYIYDSLGRRVKVVASYLQQGNPATDPADWVWSATNHRWEDGSGNAISFGTDNDQNRITTTTYDLAGRVVSTRDAAGVETRFVYDAVGRRVTTITNYLDGIYSASVPDEDLISATTYNKAGQVLSTTDARNTQTAFTYDQAARRLTVTQAAGSSLASTTYTCYDKAGRVLRTIGNWTDDPTQPAPDTKDSSGNWLFVPAHNGAYNDRDLVTMFDYDLVSRRTQVVDPMGNGTVTTYLKDGQAQSVTDPEGMVTQYRYDRLSRRTRVVQGFVDNGEDLSLWLWDEDNLPNPQWEKSDGTAIHSEAITDENIIVDVTYDKAGRVLSQRDPRGNVTTYQYDLLNRRNSLTNPINKTWATAYADLSGGKTRVTMTYPGITGATNYPVQRDFDRLGRLMSIQYGDPATTPDVKFTYDGIGNRSKMSEYSVAGFISRIRETSFGYDALHRLTSVGFDNDGNGTVDETVSYEYDAVGLRTKLTLPGNLNVVYSYDQRGQLVSLTDWDNQPTQFAYDLAGRHIATERANGLRSRYLHDAGGRLRWLRHHALSKGFAQFEYQLDKRGNCTQVCEVFQNPMVAPPMTISFDHKGIVFNGTWTNENGFKETIAATSSLSLLFLGENRKDPSGVLGDNLLLTVGTGPDHSIFDVYIGGSLWRSFDAYSATTGELDIRLEVHGDGPHVLDIRNRAEKNGNSSGYKLRFKQLVVANNAWVAQTIGYRYDALSRLVEARYAPGLNTTAAEADLLRHYLFSYDRAGNRLSESAAVDGGEPVVNTYGYDAANRINNPGYAYDPNGNLIGYGSTTYTWDRANRLSAAGSLTYQYDGLGNRIREGTLKYLFDVQPGLAVALSQTDTRYTLENTVRYLHGPRGIHAEENQYGGWNWMLQDRQGSVRGRVNNFLTLYEWDMYAPYGQQIMGGLIPNRYGFTGEPMDANGLLYLRSRYYSPNLGVFTSLDPFEGMADRPMSLNGYSWVEGNTPNMVDPSGNIPSEGEIESGRIRYSCNCGWIDADHVIGGMGTARTIQTALNTPINYDALNAIPGFRVIYVPERFNPYGRIKEIAAIPFRTNFKVYVPDNILSAQSADIGVGVYMAYETIFETFQSIANPLLNIAAGITNSEVAPSGFSEEDLPSDLMGYWLWLNYRDPNIASSYDTLYSSIDRVCKVMSKEASLFMYREYTLYGLSGAFSTNWREFRRRPRPDYVNCPDGAGCKMCGSEKWPDYFEQLVAGARSQAGEIDLTAAVTFNRPLPTNGWYELLDVGLNDYFKIVPGVTGLYVVDKSLRGC